MTEHDEEFSLKSLFHPLTTIKAIHFILLIGLVVYFNSLFNGFVGDDSAQIVNNPAVHSLANIPSFFQGSTLHLEQIGANVGLYYRPVMSTIFASIYSIFGANSFFFHATQLLLHIVNAIIVFMILKKHLNRVSSFILAIVFILHPINNETIVYISNLQEQLFALFGLLAIYFLAEKKSFLIISGLLLLSLLSKESGIIFSPALILYYFLFSDKPKGNTKYFLSSLVIVIICYIFLRVGVGNIGLQTNLLYMSENASFVERLFTIPTILLYYLKMIFFPFSISYGWFWIIKNPNFINFGLPLLIELVLFIILILPLLKLRKNKELWRTYLFFLLFFLISVSLNLQLIPLDLTVADRWFYMPLFGLLGLMGVIYESIHKKILKNNSTKIGGVIILICILLFFSFRDITRNSNWASNLSLCKHDVQINTESYLLHYCLSNELYYKKDYELAKIHAQKAINFYPEYFLSWYTLGRISFAQGEKEKAREAFEKTLSLNDFAYGSEELALVLVYEKKPKEAKIVIKKYLQNLPNSTELWYALALAEYQLGNNNEALLAAKHAYTLENSPMTYKLYYRLSNNLPISL